MEGFAVAVAVGFLGDAVWVSARVHDVINHRGAAIPGELHGKHLVVIGLVSTAGPDAITLGHPVSRGLSKPCAPALDHFTGHVGTQRIGPRLWGQPDSRGGFGGEGFGLAGGKPAIGGELDVERAGSS